MATMKNPPHPGELVREDVLAELSLSVTKAASILGVRRATLSELINEHSSVSPEMALRIEKAFGVSMDLLLKMQAGFDAAKMRQHSDEILVNRYQPDVSNDTHAR